MGNNESSSGSGSLGSSSGGFSRTGGGSFGYSSSGSYSTGGGDRSSGSGATERPPRPAHEIKTQSGLTQLYNKEVVRMEKVERALSSSSSGGNLAKVPFINAHHEGVVATTRDGSKHLIHKGQDYGYRGGDTVVTSNFSTKNWKTLETKDISNKVTISDMVKAGGETYSLNPFKGLDHCQTAAKKMMNLDKKK